MKSFLLKVVNGEEEEWGRIALLLTLGFFTGIFLATYDVATTTVFLETFKEDKDIMLAWAMVGAGTLGIISATLITTLQRIFPYKVLAFRMLATIAVIVVTLSILLRFFMPGDPTLVFIANIIIGPSNATVILLFWGIFGRLFPFRAAKRLAGGIDTGQAIATIIGLFAIPFIEPILPEISDFLLISSVAVICVAAVVFLIARSFELIESKPTPIEEQDFSNTPKEQLKASLFKNKYAQAISFFVVFSALAASFADYTFLSTASDRFPDQSELAQFLSFFGATVIIASFLVQTFLNDLIIEMFGLKVSLLLLPFLLSIFTVAALGVAYTLGYTAKDAGDNFLVFFVVISLSKLFVDALRDSLENPTVKLFFFPLDISIRFDIQTKIEGMVSQSAGLMAGIFITALERLQFFDLVECQYVILFIIVAWIFSTFRMHKGYSRVLSRTLVETKKNKRSTGENDHIIPKLFNKQLQTNTGREFAITSRIVEKVDPLLLERYSCSFASVGDDDKQAQMIQWIRRRWVFEAVPSLQSFCKRTNNHPNLLIAQETLEELLALRERAHNNEELHRLATSENFKDRKTAARLLALNYQESTAPLLVLLIRDIKPVVKRSAFLTCGKLKEEEFLTTLIDHMSVVGFENTAVSAILNYGEIAMPQLEMAFYRNGQKQNAMINIVQIYGLLGGERAINLLLRKTSVPNKRIVREVLYSLNYCNWTASGAMTSFIRNYLEQAVGNTLWLLVSTQEIRRNKRHRNIHRALQELIEASYEEIFLLLSLIYDKQSVQLIEDNIKGGTSDSIGYAMELLNIVVEDDLKPMLLPILDDSSIDDKLRRLEGQFPRDSFDTVTVLQKLMNRDYNSVDRWTRTCATHAYGRHPKTRISDDLVANIFNPDELVRETAGWAICLQNMEQYQEFCKRIPEHDVHEMNQVIMPAVSYDDEGTLLSMAKVLFLFDVPLFEDVPGMVLSDLIEWMHEIEIPAGEQIPIKNELGYQRLFIIIEGRLGILNEQGESVSIFEPYSVISNTLQAEETLVEIKSLTSLNDTKVYSILSERFYEIMGDHYALTDRLIANLHSSHLRSSSKHHTVSA